MGHNRLCTCLWCTGYFRRAPDLADGIHRAFLVNVALAVGGLLVSLLYVGGKQVAGKTAQGLRVRAVLTALAV